MKRQLLNRVIFILLLLPVHIFAQTASSAERDITGLWKGSLYNDTTKKNLPYEIAISEDKGKLSGYSYTLFDIDGKKELGVKRIKITRRNDQLFIEDITLISNNYSAPPPRKVRQQSVVNLLVSDTAMQLKGKWSTNRTREYLPLTGSMQLVREIEYRPLVLFKKLVELNLDKDLSFVKTEKKDQPDIAVVEQPATEIKLPIPAPSQRGDIDRPNEISSSVEVAKLEEALENRPAVRVMKASVQLIAILKVSKTIRVPVPGKKKELMIAANYRKKETIQPAADNAQVITQVTVNKNTEPVAAAREPVKRETKPVVETVKKAVVTEKPAIVPAAVVKVKPAPVSVVKETVKKESQTAAVIVTPPQPKKELPIVVSVPVINGAAANVSERKMNKEQFVFFESDSLVLTLYDNGDVDGDTVSVLMNGEIIFAKQGLSTTAQSKTIYIDKEREDSLSMIMYAENLGSIPPNTGLLIIMDGEKRYEVRFSADLKTNAAILLRRKIKEK